ncbi:ABC transporter substrate-binding protein [Actibacterium sp. 188UL27-1]|uniref:ABC transporter substrate-binding protein n=1 Tax=Actibacterium sp. 188UL27-1 TaxID=2786961 RepID=UPI0019588D0D|nr:ABC transporter substrate-binding protein [Actibacterium sp. 188UL27-1]MBM7069065.1 ABC transporter substrate-binding protein [Actibacterium sp. 188UL27-1]
MSDKLKHLSKLAVSGKLSRRDFLGRASALGFGAVFAGGLLQRAAADGHAAPVKGGTLKVGIQGGASTDSLDPALAANDTAIMNLRLFGDVLVEVDANGEIENRLAEEVEASADASVWTFKIRKGVQFHNGAELTPRDVMRTMERHTNEDTKSGALGILRGIKGMAVDGDKFVVMLDQPNADLPYLISDYHLVIQPDGGFDDPGAGVGTGPYRMVSNEAGVRHVYEKFDGHWDESRGHAATVELIVINDDTARVAALQSGQVHMINRVPPKVASLVGRMPSVEVKSIAGKGHYVFIMHANTAPFDNADLRLALKYAMNREEMVEKILFGNGTIGNDTPINAAYPLYTEMEQRSYDPEKAAFHFKASGHDGPVLLRTSENSFPGAVDASQLFQQSAAAAGITLEIKREPNDGYWSEVWNKQPFCTSYWGGRPTQDSMFSTAYLSTADWNDTRFFNEQFDQMLFAARAELDNAKRTAIYADMGTILHNEGGLILPMFNNFIEGVSDKVGGWAEDSNGGMMNSYAPIKTWLTEA